jgi:hypothetical protein
MIKVNKCEEQEDGSAILELDLDEETRNKLLAYAIVDLLKKMIEREENSE